MFTIRRAETRDLETLVDFRSRMFISFGVEGPTGGEAAETQEWKDFDREYLRKEIEEGSLVAWVAENKEGQIVSCAAVSFYTLPPKPWNMEGRYAYISSMYTMPESRGMGVAGKLLRCALNYAEEQGVLHAMLHASKAGKALYRAFGFEETNQMRLLLKKPK
jgi:ribosomal protein S18 acetylase RimI-like enzyme